MRRERHLRRRGGRGRRRGLARRRRRSRCRLVLPSPASRRRRCRRRRCLLRPLLLLFFFLLEPIFQMREPEHVHQAVHVRLAREVDARADVAERGVDVLGVGRAEAVHRRLVVLLLFLFLSFVFVVECLLSELPMLLSFRRLSLARSCSSPCCGLRGGRRRRSRGGRRSRSGGGNSSGRSRAAAAAFDSNEVRPRRPPRRAVRRRAPRRARRVRVRLEGARRLRPVVEARRPRALVADIGQVAEQLAEERRRDLAADGELGLRLDAVLVGDDLCFFLSFF